MLRLELSTLPVDRPVDRMDLCHRYITVLSALTQTEAGYTNKDVTVRDNNARVLVVTLSALFPNKDLGLDVGEEDMSAVISSLIKHLSPSDPLFGMNFEQFDRFKLWGAIARHWRRGSEDAAQTGEFMCGLDLFLRGRSGHDWLWEYYTAPESPARPFFSLLNSRSRSPDVHWITDTALQVVQSLPDRPFRPFVLATAKIRTLASISIRQWSLWRQLVAHPYMQHTGTWLIPFDRAPNLEDSVGYQESKQGRRKAIKFMNLLAIQF
ncbi:hypothetical protein C8R46DRAFT_349396 [Mycena filopes]|nr:hypothetical protein C8R46DRAFT_349396 [Mycena filopes]